MSDSVQHVTDPDPDLMLQPRPDQDLRRLPGRDGIDFVQRVSVRLPRPQRRGQASTMNGRPRRRRAAACSGLRAGPATHGPQIRARLGVVPQKTPSTELTVQENLWIYGRYFASSRAVRRATELLDSPTHRPGNIHGTALGRETATADDRPPSLISRPEILLRTAHHRTRPPGAPRPVGPPAPAQTFRHAGSDDALHGRGRAAVRPPRVTTAARSSPRAARA